MTKGFVTMATGDERYYKMAVNLLNSYRYFTKKPYKFAIISDQKNEYTDQFDDVVIIENAQKNYMDKIRLLEICPYDENIFIDADGNQVSYESKILNDIKDMVYRVEQRISNLEREVESLGSGQVLIEQSMAYINQFLSENK